MNNSTLVPISGGYAVDGLPLSVSEGLGLLPIDNMVGASVYDIEASNNSGGLLLELDLVLEGVDANNSQVRYFFTASAGYLVVRDVGVTWSWRPLASAAWKAQYQVAGRLSNNCRFAAITLTRFELSEADSTDGTERILQISSPGDLAPGDTVPIVAANITQDWQWVGNFEPSRVGPISKEFIYVIDFRYRDQYGNNFPLTEDQGPFFLSTELGVQVSVSQEKLNHQSAADSEFQGFLIASTWATVLGLCAAAAFEIPPLSAAFGVAAGVATAVAAGLAVAYAGDASAANDPIEPDFRLRDYAKLSHIPLPKVLEKGRRFPELRRFVRLIGTSRALEDAVYTTMPRVLGAHVSNDRDAFEKQLQHCKKALSEIRSKYSDLTRVAELAASELNSFIIKNEDRVKLAMLQVKASGIPDEIKEQLLESQVPSNLMAYADAVVRDDSFPQVILAINEEKTTILAVTLKNIAIRRVQAGKSVVEMASKFLRQFDRKGGLKKTPRSTAKRTRRK